MATKCRATNQAGQPCGAEPYRDGWCRWHHPELGEQRREWSARGGRGKSNAARAAKRMPDAMTLADLRSVLSATIGAVVAGRIEPGVANAAANLGRAMIAATEASELERRLGELEAAAASDHWKAGG